MEDTLSLDAGTDTGEDGTGYDQQTDLSDSGNPQQDVAVESKGRESGLDGKGDQSAEPLRSLEDLIELDPSEMTTAERRKFIKAGKYQLKNEGEYEARFGKAKVAGQTEDGEADPATGQPKPIGKPTDKNKTASPVADLSFLKEALPTLDLSKPEEVVKSIKSLQSFSTQMAQRNRTLEDLYPQVETGIISRLQKGPDGVREMYEQMGLEAPAWLPASSGANKNRQQESQQSQEDDILAGLRDDDFVPASAIKGLVGKAVAQALAQVDKKYAPLQESHKLITERVAKEAENNQLKETRKSALSDAQLHSDFWGEYHPEEKLTTPAEKVWAMSVDSSGRLLPQPHAEWPKLKAILQHRAQEYLAKGHPAASYKHYLYERFHDSGKSKEMAKSAEQRAKQELIEKQQRRIQPSLVNKGVNGGGLKGLVLKSVEDVERMGKENPAALREWKRKAIRGQ